MNLLEIFLNCGLVITNQIQTGVFYALSLGMKLQYLQTKPANLQMDELYGQNESEEFHSTTQSWINDCAPEFLDSANRPREFQELALNELGVDSILSKSEIMELPWKMAKIPSEPMLNYIQKNRIMFSKNQYTPLDENS